MTLSTTTFIVDLFLLLAGSLIAGEAANRLGQPALVGQLLVGVALGPTLFGSYLGLGTFPAEFSSIQFLATIFILFMAGLEIVPEEIYRMGSLTLLLGVGLFFVPFLLASVVVHALFPVVGLFTTLFIALTLSITALPVMSIMLYEFGLTGTTTGKFLLNLALINELSAVTAFAVLLQLRSSSSTGSLSIALAIGAVGIFLAVMLGLHFLIRTLERTKIWSQVRESFASNWRSKGAGFALLMVLLVGAALFSQFLGLTFVIGAFYAGLLVTSESAGAEAHESISTVFDVITWGFFVPLFFALVGLQMNLRVLDSPPIIAIFLALLAAAVLTKLGWGSFAGWLRLHRRTDSLAVGFLVTSRGAVELAMAVILLNLAIFKEEYFTIVAAVGLVTTMIAPIGALRSWEATDLSREELYRRAPGFRRGTSAAWSGRAPVEWGNPAFQAARSPYYRATSPQPFRPPAPPDGPRSSDGDPAMTLRRGRSPPSGST